VSEKAAFWPQEAGFWDYWNMEKIERVCPKCGTGNPYDRSSCVRCGSSLTNLPAQRLSNVPAQIEGASAAALVLAASAFIARTGLKLLARGILPRVASVLTHKPASSQIVDQTTEEPPDYVIRGWRAWSVHRGSDHSSGSEQFEWRINRRGGRGAGRTG
jgi:hypothetical protein